MVMPVSCGLARRSYLFHAVDSSSCRSLHVKTHLAAVVAMMRRAPDAPCHVALGVAGLAALRICPSAELSQMHRSVRKQRGLFFALATQRQLFQPTPTSCRLLASL